MPKKDVTKVKICISLDGGLHADIKKHCDKNLMKLSTYINHLIKKAHKTRNDKR